MIDILKEEPHFLVVDKPAGLFSQAAPGVESLQIELAQQLKDRDGHAGTPFIGLPHRLDRGTSGVMLIARNQRALKRFGQQFQSRKIGKFYLAITESSDIASPLSICTSTNHQNAHSDRASGSERHSVQRWEDYLRKVQDRPLAEIVKKEDEGARLAQLDVIQMAQAENRQLLLIHLHSGRMHQIRIQAASRGFYVVGDDSYRSPEAALRNKPIAAESSTRNTAPFALHALRIEFRHPQTGLAVSGTAPLPASMQNFPAALTQAAQKLVDKSRSEESFSWDLAALRIDA